MKRTRWKKLSAWFLVLSMTVSVIPGTVEAAPADQEREETVAENEGQEKAFADRFLWPDKNGKYSYTYENAEEGSMYALLVVAGIHLTLDGIGDELSTADLLYIDQAAASGGALSFEFAVVPERKKDATVILTGKGMETMIAGYIAEDCFHCELHLEDAFAVPLEIEKDTAWEELRRMLPKEGTVDISSDYTETSACPVYLKWQKNEDYDTSEAGRTFQIAARMIPQSSTDDWVFRLLETHPAMIDIKVKGNEDQEETAYRITFDTDGGTEVESCLVKAGEPLKLPEAVPVKGGFLFDGWYLDEERTKLCEEGMPVTEDMTLYAKWRADAAGPVLTGLTVSLARSVFLQGEALTEEMIHVQAVYEDGSVRELSPADFTHDLVQIDQTTAGVKVLHIQYTEGAVTKECGVEFRILDLSQQNYWEVTFDTGCEQKIRPQIVEDGSLATEPEFVPDKKDCWFAGWYIDGKQWDFATDTVSSNITLRARWLIRYGDSSGEGFFCFSEEEQKYEYTGRAVRPGIMILDKNLQMLRAGKDYSVKYTDNVNCGKAFAVVTGKGSYTGTLKVPFEITRKDLADEDAVVMKFTEYYAYKAAGYRPVPTVKYNGKTVRNGKDFTVSYQRQSGQGRKNEAASLVSAPIREPGFYSVTVSAVADGNYQGERILRFQIADAALKNLNRASVKLAKAAAVQPYTGEAQEVDGSVALKLGKTELQQGTDYELVYPEDRVNPGKKKVIARALPGNRYCFGEKSFTYQIAGIAVTSVKVNFRESSMEYQGRPVTDNLDSVTLKLDQKKADMLNARDKAENYAAGDLYTLQKGKDYTVTFLSYSNAGRAAVRLTGKGIFSGHAEKKFTIRRKSLNSGGIAVEVAESAVQNKAGARTEVTVVHVHTEGGRRIVLEEGKDYRISYSNNKKAGSGAKVTVRGIGNYTGSIVKPFRILPRSLDELDVFVINPFRTEKRDSYVYKPNVIVYDGECVLQEKKDYEVTYGETVTQMEAKNGKRGSVTVRGTGSYEGEKTMEYQVMESSIASQDCSIAIEDQNYTGEPITLHLEEEKDAGMVTAVFTSADGTVTALVPGQDYEIIRYSKNTACGKAKAVIRGVGSYTGTRTVSFRIVRQRLVP